MKSLYKFSSSQRKGIFLLVFLIVIAQLVYFYIDFPKYSTTVNQTEIKLFQKEIDSLKQLALKNQIPKIYPFNPNYITDYKGYTLGMSSEEIDRLLQFRSKGQWLNSAKQFQVVTKVSDSLLSSISPYFKFPEWVNKPKTINYSNFSIKTPKTYQQKIDLNTATAEQLRSVNGIGEKLSARIVAYRNKFKGGFLSDIELHQIYGLSPEVIELIKNDFTVKTPRPIQKVNLNSATANDLVSIPFIDYEIAHEIIEQRTLRDGFKNYNELTKVKDFPVDKLDIIKLYLLLN